MRRDAEGGAGGEPHATQGHEPQGKVVIVDLAEQRRGLRFAQTIGEISRRRHRVGWVRCQGRPDTQLVEGGAGEVPRGGQDIEIVTASA